jgi:hypothetical protein
VVQSKEYALAPYRHEAKNHALAALLKTVKKGSIS